MFDRRFQLSVIALIVGAFTTGIASAILRTPVALVVGAAVGAAILLIGWPDAARRSAARRSGDSDDSPEDAWLERSEFLCDSCKYDNDRDCSRTERPNAKTCPDFRRRG